MRMSSFATALFSCRLACHSLWFQALRIEEYIYKKPGRGNHDGGVLAEKGRGDLFSLNRGDESTIQ